MKNGNGFDDVDNKLGDGSKFSLNDYSYGMFPVMATLAKIFLSIIGVVVLIVIVCELLAK